VTEGDVLDLLQMSIWMVVIGAGPVVLSSMVVGVAIALLQALTQVQEMSLTFVPKLIVVFFVFSLTASFIGAQFYVYTERIYAQIARGFDR
jgi:flagellar biosynthetic protein FliQ